MSESPEIAYVGGIPGSQPTVPGALEELESLQQKRLAEAAPRKMGRNQQRTSSSSMTHGAQSFEPKLIAPRIGTETLSPLLPSCLYSTLECSTDSFKRRGISSAMADDLCCAETTSCLVVVLGVQFICRKLLQLTLKRHVGVLEDIDAGLASLLNISRRSRARATPLR